MLNRKFDVVYVKNGDVVAHLGRSKLAEDVEHNSGPDAFLFDFLSMMADRTVLLVSKGSRNRALRHRPNLEARTLWAGSTWATVLVAKPILMARLFVCLIRAKPAWILCGSTNSLLWASFIYSKLFGVPLIHSRHNRVSVGVSGFHRRLSTALDNACIRRAAGVVCHGPYLKKELLDAGVPDANIKEFDVDLTAFRARAVSAVRHMPAHKIVMYLGRIERLKGVFDLLDALTARLKRDEGLQLVYAGQGGASDELRRTIENHGLDGRARLLGRLPHRELAALMANSYVVVAPSRTEFAEGRCMAAMEGLAVGVPVIAPDFGPFPYLVRHGENGLLFEPNSKDDLSRKLDEVLDDPTLYAELKAGAKRSGDALLEPPLTFSQALHLSLQLSTFDQTKQPLQDT